MTIDQYRKVRFVMEEIIHSFSSEYSNHWKSSITFQHDQIDSNSVRLSNESRNLHRDEIEEERKHSQNSESRSTMEKNNLQHKKRFRRSLRFRIIELISGRIPTSRTTDHTSRTPTIRSNYTTNRLINNERISISIQHHSCRSWQCNCCSIRSVSRHCCCVDLSQSKLLNAVVPGISDIQINLIRHKDSLRVDECRRRQSITTCSRHSHCWTRRIRQWFAQHLMSIVLRTVDIVVQIDEETKTLWTDWHWRWKLCSIRCPFVESKVEISVVDEDLFVICHEWSVRRRETSGNRSG